jgi:hypothetical protein
LHEDCLDSATTHYPSASALHAHTKARHGTSTTPPTLFVSTGSSSRSSPPPTPTPLTPPHLPAHTPTTPASANTPIAAPAKHVIVQSVGRHGFILHQPATSNVKSVTWQATEPKNTVLLGDKRAVRLNDCKQWLDQFRPTQAYLSTESTVRVFRQEFTLDDTIGSNACSLQANMRVTNGISLGCPLLLPVGTVNCVQTL